MRCMGYIKSGPAKGRRCMRDAEKGKVVCHAHRDRPGFAPSRVKSPDGEVPPLSSLLP